MLPDPPDPVAVVVPVPDELVVVPEEEVPAELLPELLNCVVVVPGDRVRALLPPHPVIVSAAIASGAMAQIPFRFNRIR